VTNIGLRSAEGDAGKSRGAVFPWHLAAWRGGLAILAAMTKTRQMQSKRLTKTPGKMLNALFDAYIEGQGPASDVARKAANDRFVKGLTILRDTKDSVTKLLGP
jgi:hypothetical protein